MKPRLELRQTDYPSERPHQCAAQWRDEGWSAVEHDGRVRVFHGPEVPLPLDQAATSEVLPLEKSEATLKALNGTLRRGLVEAGYKQRGNDRYTRFLLERHQRFQSGKGLYLYRCRTWTWTFDFQDGKCWLIPKPSWTKVTEMSAAIFAARFGESYPDRHWTIVDIQSGRSWTHQILADYEEAEWSSEETRVIYGPMVEADAAPLGVEEIQSALEEVSIFAKIADTKRPRTLDVTLYRAIGERRLMVRRKKINERKEIIQEGIHRKPLYPVKLVFVLPKDDIEAREALKWRFDEGSVGTSNQRLPDATVPSVWNIKWRLKRSKGGKPLTWWKKPVSYDPSTGELSHPRSLSEIACRIEQADQIIMVTVVLLPKRPMTREARAALRESVKDYGAVLARRVYVTDGKAENPRRTWSVVTSLALKILRAAGGLPYELEPLPGTTAGTYYLGLDVGSAHTENRSNVAMVLVDWKGNVVAKRVERLGKNSERIPRRLLTEILPHWLKELSETGDYDRRRRLGAIQLEHLIVHRDGRFVDREAEELQSAFGELSRLDLIEVKKDSDLRVQVSEGPSGAHIFLSDHRTATVFNGSTSPVEVHAVSDTDVLQAAEQVYWLSEMRTDQLYDSGRLPITTFLADRIADTTC